MVTGFHGLKVAKSSTRFYVGRFFQEDEVLTHFVRLKDDFSSKEEDVEWNESMMAEIAERKEGVMPLFFTLKEYRRIWSIPGCGRIVSLANGLWIHRFRK